ncbi:MAG: 23S rRNA (adenine(2503)-C(2))-methyltransferase RlmN [Bacteroidales bacterium]|nr:23S rRNA (adenine(2503)-C(2))-methyltransferase RlmN [Bacteroidales bacterium]
MNFVGLTLSEIEEIITGYKLPKYNAREIALWIYRRRAKSFDDMTNISKKAREILKKEHSLDFKEYTKVQTSVDGTKKYLFPAGINQFIESAYIPDGKRHTLCVSSQVGCKMNCSFCMTARQGFQNQLLSRDIINQVMQIDESEQLTNIVFMGMGEPFDNVTNVMKTLEILVSDWGLAISPKKITVSTIGIVPGMKTFIENSQCNLAISLHSPFDEERKQLVPMQVRYPIADVISEIKKYDFRKHRRVSFEYILFKGLNDTPAHVKGLTKLLNGLRCRMNLIRFHAIPGSDLQSTNDEDLMNFRDQLDNKGITTTVRKSRGEDIMAACGLLSTKEQVQSESTKKRV